MAKRMTVQERRERATRWAARILKGDTMGIIARDAGLTSQRISQVLGCAGFDWRTLRAEAIAPLRRAVKVVRSRRERPPRATCEHCGRELKKPPRADGKPRFCVTTPECRAAKMRHRYATNPAHRAYSKAHVDKERHAGYFRDYYRRNKERIAARTRERYAADPEYRARVSRASSESRRKRYQNDPEYRQRVLAAEARRHRARKAQQAQIQEAA